MRTGRRRRAASRVARSAHETPAAAIAVAAMVAPAAVAACHETSSPTATATAPMTAASAMVVGILSVHWRAATAGATSSPTTSNDPTAW